MSSRASLLLIATFGMVLVPHRVRAGAPQDLHAQQQLFQAIDKANLVLDALQELGEERGGRVYHPALDAAVGRSTNLLTSHVACGSEGRTTQVIKICAKIIADWSG